MEIDLGPHRQCLPDQPGRADRLDRSPSAGSARRPGVVSSLFSEQTLAAYTSLYTEPEEPLAGIVERLASEAVTEGIKAEAVLLLVFVASGCAAPLLARGVAPRLTPLARGWRSTPSSLVLVGRLDPGTRTPTGPADPRRPGDGSRFDAADGGQRAAG